MLSFSQAGLLGILQGITELFPISSLGHSVIIPSLLGWNIDQSDPLFLSFLVATHLATALVLLGFFWRDWYSIVVGIVRSLKMRVIADDDTYARLGWLLVVGTIPAGIVGLLFQEQLRSLFASPRTAALFLAGNGVLLLAFEFLRRKQVRSEVAPGSHDDARLAGITWTQAIGIGCMQCLALLPGFSRTGATLGGGLMSGLSHEDAARYSFLLATPIILAAAVLKIPELLVSASAHALTVTLVGALCSAIAAYLSVRFLMRYFKTRTLAPFAAYCLLAGAIASFLLR